MSNKCLIDFQKPDSKLNQHPEIIQAIKNGKPALLEKHLKKLKEQNQSIQAQYEQAKATAADAAKKSSVAYSYTNRPDDTNNELNQFEPVGLKKLLKNIVQRVGSVTNALKSSLLRENGISDEEIASIKYFNDTFNKPFSQAVERIFNPNGKKFWRFKDMINYLPFRDATDPNKPAPVTYEGTTFTSKLDIPTKTAMAATIYEWLHTNGGSAIGQTNETLAALMGYAKGEQIPAALTEHLMDLGVSAETLAKQLGKKILQRMSINKTTMEAHSDSKARMEMSLGFMAIAALETMRTKDGVPYVVRQEVYTGKGIEHKGIEALKKGEPLDTKDVFHPQTPEQKAIDRDPKNEGKKGKSTAKFIKLVTDQQYTTPTHMAEGEAHLRAAPDTFNKLFDNESDDIEFSWKKIFMPDKAKIGRDGVVGTQQTSNLKKNIDVAYQASVHSMNAFLAFLETEGSALNTILGIVDDRLLLNARQKSVEGTNRGIHRDLNNLKAWIEQARLKDTGLNSLFYIAAKFMNNMRMIQTGSLNPQNSKLHRNLFTPASWTTEFDPKTDEKMNSAFLQSIALAFDIESGKVGGVQNQLAKLDKLLQKPEFVNAIQALQEYQATGIMTDNHKNAIAAAVQDVGKVGGDRMHTFKGLVEYARYKAHTDGLFSTDMYNEIDGVSNGPIIGILMLIPDSAKKQELLASLAMGGISVDRSNIAPNLDELLGQYNLNDAYQRMAQQWAYNIAKMKEDFSYDSKHAESKKDRQTAKQNLAYSMALQTLLGKFTEHIDSEGNPVNEGIINKLIRKLAKPRTMQTMYGAGINRQNMVLSGENVISDGIYGGIEKIIKRIDKNEAKDLIEADFKAILHAIGVLTNQLSADQNSSHISLARFMTDGILDTALIKEYRLDKDQIKQITSATRKTYGQAMENAIDKVYAAVIEARQPFNTIIQRAATIYNLVLKSRVEAQIAANAAEAKAKGIMVENKDVGRITNAQLEAILKDIEYLIPKIKTPNHTEADPSFLTLAEVGRQKNESGNKTKSYDEANEVVQSYTAESDLFPHRGYVENIPYLKEVGVSALVRSIQMLDSMIANNLMGLEGVDILNAHDGFPHSIKDSEAVRDNVNTRFRDVMTNYSLGQAIADMYTEMAAKGTPEAVLAANGISNEDLIAALFKDGVINFDTYGVDKKAVKERVELKRDIAKKLDEELDYFTAKKELLEEVSGFKPGNTDEENKARLADLFSRITDDAANMAEQVTVNKQEVTDNVTHWAQYPFNGTGISAVPADQNQTIFPKENGGVDPNAVLSVDAAATDSVINSLKDLRDKNFLASSADNVSTDINDYPNSQNIDAQNVADVFDSIVALDNQAAHASVQNSPEHLADLKRILNDIVARVMTPIEMFITEHRSLQEDTRGLYVIEADGKKVYIQRQNTGSSPAPGMLTQGIRMSAAEVYAHEMIHHITHFGLKMNTHLRNQASTLYDLAFTEFKKTHGDTAWKVFMNDPNADLNDPANAHEMIAAQERWDYVFNPTQRADNSNAGLDEFLAHAMTNENFKRELNKLVIDPATLKTRSSILGIFEKNIQQTVVNLFTRIMDFIQNTFYHQQHSLNVSAEIEHLVRALSQVETRQKNVLYMAAMKAEAKASAFGVKMDDKIKNQVSKQMNKTAIGKMITQMKQLPELDNYLSHQMRLTMLWYNDQEQGLIPSIVNEMAGVTERFRPLYDLLAKRKLVIDQAKNDVAQVMRDVQNSFIRRKLTSHEKAAITKVLLKGDISSLLGQNSLAAIQGFIENKTKRQTEIDALLAQLKTVLTPVVSNAAELHRFMNFFTGGVTDLAYGMITSTSFKEGVNYRNAHNLAMMSNTGYDGVLTGVVFNQVVGLLDKAASIKSIDFMREADKKTISKLMSEDMSGIENVMTSHNLLKQQVLTDLFHDNPTQMEKGYTKTILNGRIQMEFGTIADEKRLADQGFIRHGKLPRDPEDPIQDHIYIYTNVGGGTINDLQEGITSFTANKTKGANSYDIQHQIGNEVNPEFEADANNKTVLVALNRKIQAMMNSTVRTSGIDLQESYMTPKFNAQGKMVSMRYIMSEFAKDTYLQQFSEFDSVLAAMASTRVDKIVTPEINLDVVIALKDMWDADKTKYAGSFVKISPTSEHKRYRDIYNMFTPMMKKQILSHWGKNEIMVSQEMVDLVFGQRKYTILEMFGKTKAERNMFESVVVEGMQFALGFMNPFVDSDKQVQSILGRTANRAKSIEDFLIQLTKLAKGNIVVRNFFVTWGNHVSNVMYLKSKGIPLKTIIPLQREAIDSALRYQADNSKLHLLVNKRNVVQAQQSLSAATRSVMVENLNREIRRLENEIAINPSTAMIESGLLPSIVDDVDTGHVQSPYKFGLNKAIDTGLSKLPKLGEKIGRTLFMTEDTESYRMLNNAVKMTDYVGRYVLYKHYTAGGMLHKDAVSAVAAEFIDFAPPTHRMIEYANNIGLMWFTKYQLRVLKHIKNVVLEHPFSTLATFIIGQQLGNQNILNSIPGVTKGMLSFMGNPFAALLSGGPEILYVNGLETMASVLAGD